MSNVKRIPGLAGGDKMSILDLGSVHLELGAS